jgi:hypothetical protein
MLDGASRTPNPQDSSEGTGTPDQVALIIAYALSRLSVNNAHHEFEHICRHITRRRIASNIIPATGPVSAGGDGGADFETISVSAPTLSEGYWRLVATGKTLFACSLEQNLKKKIKQDLSSAARFPEPVEKIYFFTNQAVAVGTRNKLKRLAVADFQLQLEIIDGEAIAEFLADSELFWIAERYLSLPISLRPLESSAAPKWYKNILQDLDSDISLSSDTFYQLKSAVRHATFVPEFHSDIPRIVRSLQRFREHPLQTIARRAFYEEFVAMLRGLNAAEGYEEQVLEYLSIVQELRETDELEEASNILGYAAGATARGILAIPLETLAAVHSTLLARIIAVTPEKSSFVRCACLFIRGSVELKSSYVDLPLGDDPIEELRVAAKTSITTWTQLLEEVEQVRIFPIERLSSIADFLFPYIDEDWLEHFVKRLDVLVAKRLGSEQTAESLVRRGTALLDQEQHFRALNVFHEALESAQEARSQRTAVTILLQLAELYQFLRLYHAAKYYALSAAFAALSLKDDDLKELAAVGLAVACEADYASRSSMLFFLTYQMFVGFAIEYRLAGTEAYKQKKWGTVDYYAVLLTRASMLLGPAPHTLCLEFITKAGLYDQYSDSKEQLNQLFETFEGDFTKLAHKYSEEAAATPFSDLEDKRQIAWSQEGIEWQISWSPAYQAERLGSAFCAVIQVALSSLHKSELTLAATKIAIHLSVDEVSPALRQLPSNESLQFGVNLAYIHDLSLTEATWAVFQILKIASAMPDSDFDKRLKSWFQTEVPNRCGTYVSPSEAFRQFYSRESYEGIQSVGRGHHTLPVNVVETRTDVSTEADKIHPAFDAEDCVKQIELRYKRITELYPFTIAALAHASAFQATLKRLKEQGWKDWHVLQAVASIRVNDLGHRAIDRDRAFVHHFQNGENEIDPPTPPEKFTETSMLRSLQMSQLSTLANLGLRVKHLTPNLVGIDHLLGRFRYWELDVPHDDPFKAAEQI